MELSPAQRKLTFAWWSWPWLALGVYLFVPRSRGGRRRTARRGPSHSARPAATGRARPSPAAPSARASASAAPGPAATQNSDIYQWLPFTPAGLAAAAEVAAQFGAAYGTYSYTENAAAYVATMRGLVSPQLRPAFAEAYSAPGRGQPAGQQKQVATGSAEVIALRAFGPQPDLRRDVTQKVTAPRARRQQDQPVTRSRSPAATPELAGHRHRARLGGELVIGRTPPGPSPSRAVILGVVAVVGRAARRGLLVAPMLMFAGSGLLFASGTAARGRGREASQPPASQEARNSIPANYLRLFKRIGAKYGVPWVILAGIGKVESDDGRTTLPGVHSGSNAFGAAGPMQIGIGGASGNTWGGAPVHPASEQVSGVATDGDGDGIASVYDPADAIAGAAKYLLEHGVLDNVQRRHLRLQPPGVLRPDGAVAGPRTYASGGFTVSPVTAGRRARTACPASGSARRTRVDRARDRLRRGSSSASRTCGAAPARTRSTARAWS